MALVKYNNNSISTISSAGQLASGSLVPIKTLTASSSSTLSFVDGSNGVVLDNTYPIYKFEFINCHPATNNVTFGFQANASGGSGYNETMTTTNFRAYNFESNSGGLDYIADNDQAQGTGFQIICGDVGNVSDENIVGEMFLFSPSSTTFVKHFMSRFVGNASSDYAIDMYTAGYFNTTSAIDEIQFKMSSGNIDSGKIKLYGIKDS
jgi:hypothetical protein